MPGHGKPATILSGRVETMIPSPFSGEPERAQIAMEGADHLYREIRIENTMTNAEGETVSLKRGAEVGVTIVADPKDTVKKSD